MILIPKPCSESWDKMTPAMQGRHCAVCSKVVVDFSNCSNEEIIGYFSLNKDRKTCGRFRTEQVSNSNTRSALCAPRRITRFLAAIALVFGVSLFVSCGSDNDDHQVMSDVCVDSATMANNMQQMKTDSAHRADSLASIPAIPEENRLSKADSTKVADSVARNRNSVRDFK